ncbi:MAG: hypothetical protein IJR49_00775 [Treponema sp.]|nr:hypothetical protein [Treponema sp.]
MTEAQFIAFEQFRSSFKKKVVQWNRLASKLIPVQKKIAEKDTPSYPVETPIVYNTDLDTVTRESDIRLIVVGDNPGKDEQLKKNRKYLVGLSGKIAVGFFRKNSTLGIDFRKNVIILNKTPVHTAKTKHLHALQKESDAFATLVNESQIWMAEQTASLHVALVNNADIKCEQLTQNIFNNNINFAFPALWIVGYAELKQNGIFLPYRDALKQTYLKNLSAKAEKEQKSKIQSKRENLIPMYDAWQYVFVYQHFSMNRFSIDLQSHQKNYDNISLTKNLYDLGQKHRIEIFGE